MNARGQISGAQLKEVYAGIRGTERSAEDYVKEHGLFVMSDAGELETMARALIEANPKQVQGYRAGKTTLLGFFVGQIMKQTGGKADPAVVNTVVKGLLDEGGGAPTTTAVSAITPAASKAPAVTTKSEAVAPAAASKSEVASPGVTRPPTTMKSTEVPAGAAPSVPAAAGDAPELVSYDAFAKVDIRVGLITQAARVPKKDKLLDLRVDTGDAEPRRIVAGLGLSFKPEELVNQRVLVVCNLEPRAFSKDLVSHGMILASGPSEALALATVSREVPPGTRVK
jgi:methionine--tRNA ligase beta chain